MTSWAILQRQVMLRANHITASDASALSTAYNTAAMSQTIVGDRGMEFPFTAINDAICNSAEKMVQVIGNNLQSPYRKHFLGVTSPMTHNSALPTQSAASKPIVGMLGPFRDQLSGNALTFAPYNTVVAYVRLATNILKNQPYLYYTDNARVWHTTTTALADCVQFSVDDTLTDLATSSTSCPFPPDIHETLVCGALSYIFRGNYNVGQVDKWRQYFEEGLQTLAQKVDVE